MLAVPILIFCGLPATVANGSYRLAVVLQNIAAVTTFERKGVHIIREARWLVLPSLLGAAAGALVAVEIDEQVFRRLLSVVLVVLIPVLFLRKGGKEAISELPRRKWLWPAALALGFYGGLLQLGVGFLYLAVFAGGLGLNLVKTNAIKVFLVLAYSLVALGVFAWSGQFSLVPAGALAAGNACGGWMGARLAIGRGDRFIRWVVAAAALFMAAKLAGLF